MSNTFEKLMAGRSRSEMRKWAGTAVMFAALCFFVYRGQLNLVLAIIVSGILMLISLRDKVSATVLTFAYLTLLGDIRRIADVMTGMPQLDFLLLVGPAVAFMISLPILMRLKLRDGLSKAMFYLMLMMVLQIFNPKQGGIAVGFAGAMFYIVPVLWFWIGRRYGTPAAVEKILYQVLFPLAVLAALLGFYQTFVGFFPYELAWIAIAKANYAALNVGSSIRAFGFSVSSAEYATLLVFGAAGCAGSWFGRRPAWILAFPILVTGMFLSSSRGSVFMLALALSVVWIMRRGRNVGPLGIARLVIFILVSFIGISYAASRFAPDEPSSSGKQSAVDASISHQTGGLAHPFDSRYSTAGIHSGMFFDAIVGGFTYPIGYGIGSNTGAGGKFGVQASDAGSSEIDLSDAFLQLGFVGGFIYLYVFFATLRGVFAYTYEIPLGISLPVLAILICTMGRWLAGGQYGTATVLFFFIGAIAHNEDKKTLPKKKPAIRGQLVTAA